MNRPHCLIVCITICINSVSFFLPLFTVPIFKKLSILQRATFSLVTLDFSIATFILNATVIWLSSYISTKKIAFKIIKHKTQEENVDINTLQSLINHVNKLETITDQFNGFTATYLITWFIFVISMMVHQLYQNLLYIRYQLYYIVLASAPTIIAGGGTMYFVCTISAEYTCQVGSLLLFCFKSQSN